MGQKYRSARGEIVDIDLVKIKQQIASTPKPVTVQEREKFVDKRIRRRVKKQVVDDDGLDVGLEVKQALAEDFDTTVEEPAVATAPAPAPTPTPIVEAKPEPVQDSAYARPVRRKKEK